MEAAKKGMGIPSRKTQTNPDPLDASAVSAERQKARDPNGPEALTLCQKKIKIEAGKRRKQES